MDRLWPRMIHGTHLILYSQDAAADRAFIRDVVAFPAVDAGGGWLIFEPPRGRDRRTPRRGRPPARVLSDVSVSEQRWDRLTAVRPPSGAEPPPYAPRHPMTHSLWYSSGPARGPPDGDGTSPSR
ncbi:hypothetical protein SAMN05216533_0824 [Streptomyces sp. Ag109_O5-10]|nr:hypothetical protein SAMN05216533_0824 [Streptomyces sp. Ag109_O5-10]